MKISGADTLPYPVAQVWDSILDPRVLVATIPGCERLAATGEHCYDMTVTAGVAAIKGTYAGSCALSDLQPHRSLVMTLQGAGAPGTIDATVDVHFDEVDGGTRVSYDADAVVGGMVGGVGQRMLTSVSRRMAQEFFGNVGRAIAGGPEVAEARAVVAAVPGAVPVGTEARPGVFTAPPQPAGVRVEDDFVKGVVLGAGLVLAGVVAGGIVGRRR